MDDFEYNFQPKTLGDRIFLVCYRQFKSAKIGLEVADAAFKMISWVLIIGTLKYLGNMTHSRAIVIIVYALEFMFIFPFYFLLSYVPSGFKLRNYVAIAIISAFIGVSLNYFIGNEVDRLTTAMATAQQK